jgi:hypothetical protein
MCIAAFLCLPLSNFHSCALRFDLLVASCDSVTLKFEKSPTEDENSPLSVRFCVYFVLLVSMTF